jgi:uncharacterized protein YlaI
MLNFFKNSNSLDKIACPNCLEEQDIPEGAISAFCKNCRTRIDIKTLRDKNSPNQPPAKWKPKTIPITCPLCNSLQEVLSSALSAYCKNCNQRISIKEDMQADYSKTVSVGMQRNIECPHCGITQKVPSTALSSFCTECGNRINLQNYEIKGRYRGNLETKGVIYISDDGFVEGNINTGSLIIAGKFKGEIVAEEKVSLKNTAKLYGKVISPSLEADAGSIFIGHLHIGKQSN